jgi:hypothetical protein
LNPPLVIAVLEFASPAALGWLAAAALPWLINLWNRRRHVEAPWAAVELLMEAIRERSRRLRLRELLLLAMRTAILALAALAAAQPVWKSSAGAAALVARTHHLLVVDRSFSMATRADNVARCERAKGRARQLVDGSPAGDAFSIIAWGQTADNVLGRPTFDAAAAAAALDSIAMSDGVAELPTAVTAVLGALDAGGRELPDIGRSEVVFLSDLTRTAWAAALPPVTRAATAAPARGDADFAWRELNQRAPVAISSVDDGQRDNAAVVAMEVDPALPTLDAPLSIGVHLEAHGRRTWRALPVDLLLDGVPVGRRTADLPPGDPIVVRFEARIVEAGAHVFEARIPTDCDSLSVDNRRWFAVEARRRARVILFFDAAGAADEIARALNPRRGTKSAGGPGVEIKSAAALASTNLADYDAAYLCNVAVISPREQDLLRRYVANGGAAVFVLGSRVEAGAYNGFFSQQAAGDGLPAAPLLPIEVSRSTASGEWRLDPLEYRHPVLAPFAGRSRAGLLNVRVSRYLPLKLAGDASRAQTVLALSSGDPALVVGDYGLGRVAVMSVDPSLRSPGGPATTLAVSPAFLPLMRELFGFLAADRRMDRLNRLVGQTIAAPSKSTQGGAKLVWKSPDERELPAVVSNKPTAVDAWQRGVYSLQVAGKRTGTTGDGGEGFKVAVNLDPRESDLSTIDVHEIMAASNPAAPGASDAGTYSVGIAFQRPLFMMAAALVLIELLVAWLLGRGWA